MVELVDSAILADLNRLFDLCRAQNRDLVVQCESVIDMDTVVVNCLCCVVSSISDVYCRVCVLDSL